MKNILGTEEDLSLYNKDGKRVYEFFMYSTGVSYEYTYDSNGNELTYKNSKGDSYECTYDSNNNILTYRNSDSYSYERTYDSNDNVLTFKDSNGYSYEKTYDLKGNQLTYKNSNGETRGFDIPEYTMEQLVEKIGNFKIKI